MLATTAGEGAGVWMAGQGAAADAQGYLYVLTGNGDFDGVSQWGESFLKLKYTPAAAHTCCCRPGRERSMVRSGRYLNDGIPVWLTTTPVSPCAQRLKTPHFLMLSL